MGTTGLLEVVMVALTPTSSIVAIPGSYQFTVSSCERDTVWDDFVANVPNGRQVQSSQWACIKHDHGWDAFRLIATKQGIPVGGIQMLVRPIRRLGYIGMAAHGPVLHPYNPELASVLIEELLQLCRHQHLRGVVIQPPPNGEQLATELRRHHFYPCPAAVAPTADTVLDLSHDLQAIMNGMRRQARQNVRRGQRGGVVVRHGQKQDLHTFFQLHSTTAQRRGFSTYSEYYFQKMWDRLAPENGIKVFIGAYEGRDISALLLTTFGDRVYAKSSGWTGEEQERRPNEAVFWAAIEWAQAAGYHYFDFEGFDRLDAQTIETTHEMPSEWHNTSSFFKYGFGGEVLIYPLAYHHIFNPVLRWAVNHVALPLIEDDSALNRVPAIQALTSGVAQRFANHERTRD